MLPVGACQFALRLLACEDGECPPRGIFPFWASRSPTPNPSHSPSPHSPLLPTRSSQCPPSYHDLRFVGAPNLGMRDSANRKRESFSRSARPNRTFGIAAESAKMNFSFTAQSWRARRRGSSVGNSVPSTGTMSWVSENISKSKIRETPIKQGKNSIHSFNLKLEQRQEEIEEVRQFERHSPLVFRALRGCRRVYQSLPGLDMPDGSFTED